MNEENNVVEVIEATPKVEFTIAEKAALTGFTIGAMALGYVAGTYLVRPLAGKLVGMAGKKVIEQKPNNAYKEEAKEEVEEGEYKEVKNDHETHETE